MNTWHTVWHVGVPSLKLGTPSARWHVRLNNWHTFGTLAPNNVKLARIWHFITYTKLARMTRMARNYQTPISFVKV